MAQPIQLVIFGARGDLARRKLLPALLRLLADARHELPVCTVGLARTELRDDAFRAELREALPAELHEPFERFAPSLFYQAADAADPIALKALADRLDALPGGRAAARLYYLALAPELFVPAVRALGAAGLLHGPPLAPAPWRRIVVEKPFGRDLASARQLNAELHELLAEEQIYRIDHYLGKETVQNVLGLRFHNAVFEPLWNRHHVQSVQISAAEQLGVDGRGSFYEGVGALRDMVQSHLLQLLALIAMEPPASLDAEAMRGQKVEVLRALLCPDPHEAPVSCVRARYGPGVCGGAPVRGYLEEDGVAPDSRTETYVALRVQVANWRWNGVPFLLRHGKRLARRFTEIRVQFHRPPIQLFNRPEGIRDEELQRQLRDGGLCGVQPNTLVLELQPREAIVLCIGVKQPGPAMVMTPAPLEIDYRKHFGQAPGEAYERLLLDALAGDPSLFLRADEIEAAWRYVDEVRALWSGPQAPPLHEYAAGSEGPAQADALLRGSQTEWSRSPGAPECP